MITLLGVSHVFRLGPRIREEVERRRPDVIALELDPARLRALEDPSAVRRTPGVYSILAGFQRRIAEEYGADVGEEMLAARNAGQRLGIPVALIDIDSRVTWQRLWLTLGPLEVLKLLFSAFGSLFVGREQIESELQRYQADYDGFMEALGRDYPAVKKVLVDGRNEHMAKELGRLAEAYAHVLAVVGDGHVQGLSALLGGAEVEVVRLWELRQEEAGPTPGDT
ncbi:MAG: TraB/GumN family protein [Thermoplasmata archaeon]|nr:TraB/GumN family protein [Thermoplasmata archaeon]